MKNQTSGLLKAIRNPFYVPKGIGARDAAILWHDGVLHCFYTASFRGKETFYSHIEHVCSRDLVSWERCPDVVSDPPIFWSVGNVIHVGGEWVLCMQDYRVPPGEKWAGDDARLWTTRSADLMTWDPPVSINPGGANVNWRPTRRQVDPFIVEHDGRYWCFYKGGGLGLLVSDDLLHWEEACVDRPAFAPADTPDNCTMENPCVVRDGDEYVLFFTAMGKGGGLGIAWSRNLTEWRDSRYLAFPKRPWMRASNIPNAAMVIDTRADLGVWMMVFDANHDGPHTGELCLAWSQNLTDWECP